MRLLLRESGWSRGGSPPAVPSFTPLTFSGYVLENSEDDTKSLFVIIEVPEL